MREARIKQVCCLRAEPLFFLLIYWMFRY